MGAGLRRARCLKHSIAHRITDRAAGVIEGGALAKAGPSRVWLGDGHIGHHPPAPSPPPCHQPRRSALSAWRVMSSSAANGSSINSSFGRVTRARAIDVRIFMPPDNCAGCAPEKAASPTLASTCCTVGVAALRDRPCKRSGSQTLSNTVAQGISVGSWKTKAVSLPPHPRSAGAATVPVLGVSSPATRRSTALLPQPDGPSNATNSPAPTVSDTPASANRPLENTLSTRCSWINGSGTGIAGRGAGDPGPAFRPGRTGPGPSPWTRP